MNLQFPFIFAGVLLLLLLFLVRFNPSYNNTGEEHTGNKYIYTYDVFSISDTGSYPSLTGKNSSAVVTGDTTDNKDFPRILFTDGPLDVNRNGELLTLGQDSVLLTGDTIETGSSQFAVILFPPEAHMIIQPASKLKLKSDSTIHLISADILIDSGNYISLLPNTITCFESTVTHYTDSHDPASFMMQCRGQSGIILASHKGIQQLQSHNKTYHVSPGDAILGRASSSAFMEAFIPEKPVLSDQLKMDNYYPVDTTGLNRLYWQPVPMTDQYLIHLVGTDTVTNIPVHNLIYQRDHQILTDSLPKGSYKMRVAAVDYYGVVGNWSEPWSFER